MIHLKEMGVIELNAIEMTETNGGSLISGIGSLFRSSLYLGSRAVDSALTTLGFLAGLGDGIRSGMDN